LLKKKENLISRRIFRFFQTSQIKQIIERTASGGLKGLKKLISILLLSDDNRVTIVIFVFLLSQFLDLNVPLT
jgi:hypothetical protein